MVLSVVLISAVDLRGQAVGRSQILMRRVAREWAQKAAEAAFPNRRAASVSNGYNLRGDSVRLCPSVPWSPLVNAAAYDFSAELYDPEGTLFFDKRFSFPLYSRPCAGSEPHPGFSIGYALVPSQVPQTKARKPDIETLATS